VWVVVFNTISGERPSLSIVLSTLLASVGVLIATYTDTSVDALGVVTALASAAIAGLASRLCKQAPVGWLVGWLMALACVYGLSMQHSRPYWLARF
jgi:drug/metabolite transporter (DMT)-like permease